MSQSHSTDSALKLRLQQDLTTAMRARDELSTATLRMVLTAVKMAEVSGDEAHALDDDQVKAVLTKEAKKRREAATAFADAGRQASAERELAELGVIESYLPRQLTPDELAAIIDQAVADVTQSGVTGMPAMGKVMKAVQPQIAGRADGAVAAALVRKRLSEAH